MAEKQKPQPRGKALNSSDEELDQAAEITLEDMEVAKDAARRHGRNSDLRRILEAEPE